MTRSVKKSAMASPTPAATRLHMIRVRSSVRWSKKDILPSADSDSAITIP